MHTKSVAVRSSPEYGHENVSRLIYKAGLFRVLAEMPVEVLLTATKSFFFPGTESIMLTVFSSKREFKTNRATEIMVNYTFTSLLLYPWGGKKGNNRETGGRASLAYSQVWGS